MYSGEEGEKVFSRWSQMVMPSLPPLRISSLLRILQQIPQLRNLVLSLSVVYPPRLLIETVFVFAQRLPFPWPSVRPPWRQMLMKTTKQAFFEGKHARNLILQVPRPLLQLIQRRMESAIRANLYKIRTKCSRVEIHKKNAQRLQQLHTDKIARVLKITRNFSHKLEVNMHYRWWWERPKPFLEGKQWSSTLRTNLFIQVPRPTTSINRAQNGVNNKRKKPLQDQNKMHKSWILERVSRWIQKQSFTPTGLRGFQR